MTAASRLAAGLDRYRVPILALLSILFFVRVAAAAKLKPFWHDEIYTVLLARLPTAGAHWEALRDGVDYAPPLNGFATRAVRALAGSGPVAARVPAMLGFWTMTLTVFAMVRTRGNATLAFTAALLPFFTAAYRYSYEARPYGLMLGLAGLAWLAWSEAARGRHRKLCVTVMALALAAGLWNHYFAILVYAPIVSGELARSIRSRRVDVPLWIAGAASLAAALPLAPMIRQSAAGTRHFWVRPAAGDIPAAYGFLFGGLTGVFPVWALAVIGGVAVISYLRPFDRNPRIENIPVHEAVAAAAAILIPVLGVVIALVATGGFVPRYGMAAVIAVAVALPLAVARIARRGPLVDVALLGTLVFAYSASLLNWPQPKAFESPVKARPLLERSLRTPGPTVGSGQVWFLQLWFYAPLDLKGDFVYLADPDRALRYTGSDVVDRNYLALARWTPVRVERLDAFTARHRDFRIYASGAGWLLDYLHDAGAHVDMLGTEPGGQLYTASLPAR